MGLPSQPCFIAINACRGQTLHFAGKARCPQWHSRIVSPQWRLQECFSKDPGMWRVQSWLFFVMGRVRLKNKQTWISWGKIMIYYDSISLSPWNLELFGYPLVASGGSHFLWKQALEGCDALAILWRQRIVCHSFFDFQIPHVQNSSNKQPGAWGTWLPCTLSFKKCHMSYGHRQ